MRAPGARMHRWGRRPSSPSGRSRSKRCETGVRLTGAAAGGKYGQACYQLNDSSPEATCSQEGAQAGKDDRQEVAEIYRPLKVAFLALDDQATLRAWNIHLEAAAEEFSAAAARAGLPSIAHSGGQTVRLRQWGGPIVVSARSLAGRITGTSRRKWGRLAFRRADRIPYSTKTVTRAAPAWPWLAIAQAGTG